MRPIRLILCLCLVFPACHKHVRVPITALPPAPPPAPEPVPEPAPAPVPPPAPVAPPPVVSPLNAADRAFGAGSYDEAARGYDDYLHANPEGTHRDHALFYFGLCLTVRPGPTTDWTRAAAAFKELVDQHPESKFSQPASVILSLRSDLDQAAADSKQLNLRNKALSTELDRLKKIDAERAERRK